MDKALLRLHGMRYAVREILRTGSCSFAKLIDGQWQTIDWTDIDDYITEMIDQYAEANEDKSTKVLFVNIFGMEIIPDRRFNNLQEADEYALAHGLSVVGKIKIDEVENYNEQRNKTW